MKILRWIFFLPIAAILIAIAQTLVMVLAESLHWYFTASILIFFGWTALVTTYLPCMIAPNHKIASTIVLSLFILLEGGTLIMHIHEYSWIETIARLYVDLIVIFGAVGAYQDERKLGEVFSGKA